MILKIYKSYVNVVIENFMGRIIQKNYKNKRKLIRLESFLSDEAEFDHNY